MLLKDSGNFFFSSRRRHTSWNCDWSSDVCSSVLLGIHLHQIWLVYLGYGALGGCGLGIGYITPVSTLITWFPDRRGMATGMAIMGFGGGALVRSEEGRVGKEGRSGERRVGTESRM